MSAKSGNNANMILAATIGLALVAGCPLPAGISGDAEDVAADKAALEVGFTFGDSSVSVTRNLTLGNAGSRGSTIAWSSDVAARIGNDGAVSRPLYRNGDASVTLTATISKGNVGDTKRFDLIVLKSVERYVHFQVTVPAGTPDSDICLTSSLQGWSHTSGTKLDANTYLLTIEREERGASIEYKYTRGSWGTVEKGANGSEMANRVYAFTDSEATVYDTVATWADLLP